MTVVYVRHTRVAKLCARGCRAWFEQHGLSWVDFLHHGATAETLRATGSALCEPVIKIAEADG